MERPERKRHINQVPPMDSTLRACGYFEGYNHAYGDWERYEAKLKAEFVRDLEHIRLLSTSSMIKDKIEKWSAK